MIELLNIMPISYMKKYYLEDNHNESCIIMAHLILKNQKYLNLALKIKSKGHYIVLDNSTPYLGSSVSPSKLLECINLISPNEIILPDVLDDSHETINRTKEFLNLLPKKHNFKLMAVPQGYNLDEYKKCYDIFVKDSRIDNIGLSFSISNLFDSSLPSEYITYREFLVNIMVDEGFIDFSKNHHLLGFSDSGNIELEKLSRYPFIIRCDSNAGYKAAREKIILKSGVPYSKPKNPINFYAKFNFDVYKLMKENILVLNNSANSKEKIPVVIKDKSIHTMKDQLFKYLDIKVHHLIKERNFDKILVKRGYNRNLMVSKSEKNDKMFNCHRPTAELNGNDLTIFVPTGKDYVMHHASLIATYLALSKRKYNHVLYLEPTLDECESFILNSNLNRIKPNKIVIMGFGLTDLFGSDSWNGKGTFLYKHVKIGINEVTLLGCKHSLWGDIAEIITKYLANNLGVKTLIYIGKLGSLKKWIEPNSYLATGNTSFIKCKEIKWANLFDHVKSTILIKGDHYTSPSTLLENKKWLIRNKNFDFVDPEVGYFAKGAVESKVDFSYLHIISNNLKQMHNENLSNEREQNIIKKRRKLLAEIKRILSSTNLTKNI